MVKFGRHQKWFLDHHPGAYVVPYNDFKANIEEDFISEEAFESRWRSYLEHARKEFDATLQMLWRQVFSSLYQLGVEEGRGAPPEKALVLFSQYAPGTEAQEILAAFKSLHASAYVNAEALRKLVKKYDKVHQKQVLQNSTSNELVDLGGNKHETSTELTTAEAIALSCKLLPEVYSSNFVVGLTALTQGIELLRSELGFADHVNAVPTPQKQPSSNGSFPKSPSNSSNPFLFDDDADIGMTLDDSQIDMAEKAEPQPKLKNGKPPKPHSPKPPTNNNKPSLPPEEAAAPEHTFTMLTKENRKDSHAEHLLVVDRRRQELHWLKQSTARLHKLHLIHKLVAHRGFHSPKDRSDLRPLENSLQAYESAWTSGIYLCECDIALTKDEYLILAHDQDFSRLALDSSSDESRRQVRDLTLKEIMGLALKSGSRPPLLMDVLQSAHAIGDTAQLIIEIKPGNREAATALAALFGKNPHLMAHCAVVMSFDSFVMHSLLDEMDATFGPSAYSENADPHRRSYSMGILPVSSASRMDATASSPKASKHPRPKLLVLTVCDPPKREIELQVSITEENPYEKLHGWVKGRLDGVYMQFEPHMVTPEGSKALKKLARRYHVGIWGYNGRDPDHFDTFSNLVQQGNASFVNTDLPRDFFLETPDGVLETL